MGLRLKGIFVCHGIQLKLLIVASLFKANFNWYITGTGSLLHGLEVAAQRKAFVCGKPYKPIIDVLIKEQGCRSCQDTYDWRQVCAFHKSKFPFMSSSKICKRSQTIRPTLQMCTNICKVQVLIVHLLIIV